MRVFITGASSGLGAALAVHYAAQGAIIGLVGRDEARLDAIRSTLATTSERYALDVADSAAMQAAAAHFIARHGVPEIVIGNAGISVGVDTADADDLAVLEAVRRTLAGRMPQAQAEGPWRAVLLCSLMALLVVSNVGFPWRMASTGALFALCLAGLAASDARLGAVG